MEQYSVPQFIEREAKIAIFLNWRQFIYLIVGGVICFILYYIIPSKLLFMFIAIIVISITAAMAFLKVGSTPLPALLWSSLGFLTGVKSYTWKKKEVLYPYKVIKKAEIKEIGEKEKSRLKIADKSRLKKLSKQIEFRTK